MNEARHTLMKNMAGNTQSQEEQEWQDLIQRYRALLSRVTLPKYLDKINNIIKSLSSNKPKRKVYRAQMKRLEELEQTVNRATHSSH